VRLLETSEAAVCICVNMSEGQQGEQVAYVGLRHTWNGEEPFVLSESDRRQHVYVVGKTGTGKTTLLRNLIIQDICQGKGVGLIDPHGDLAQELLDHIPPWRADDLVYFNPADREYPIGLNLLNTAAQDAGHLIASGVVGAMKGIWRDSWGARLEYVLYSCVAALTECDNVSLLGVRRMLSDQHYRRWVVRQVKDPAVLSFWRDEFESYDKRFLAEVIAPVQNKIGQLYMAPPLRNVQGHVRSKVDLLFMMDNRRILIANLSKGKLGEDKASLLGSLLVAWFQLAALSRADVPESQRTPFHLYVDEFASFTTDSFASMLSESRKYGLSLVLANQYLGQTRPEIRDAVFGNVGTIISFRVGEADALVLEREFGRDYIASQFSRLANFEVYARLASGTQVPFKGTTLDSVSLSFRRREKLIRRSREKYSTPRKIVEDKIRRWSDLVGEKNRPSIP
jgi:hypothetical protein